MDRRLIRNLAVVVVLLATITIFVRYFTSHPALRHQLAATAPSTLALILVLYVGTVVALVLVNKATLRLCQVDASRNELLLLTAYTAVINFFGPLQSGPAVRAVYLKKRYDLNLKTYALATFVYYFFYAAFSGLFLLSGVFKWWLMPLTALGLLILYGLAQTKWLKPQLAKLDLRNWYYLALATLLQLSLVAAIYYVELRSVLPAVHLSQTIVYAGAANFALFVSITPGAIGFRESFLVFSRHLHHLTNSTIVAANIIDRGMYLVLLLCLGVLIVATHASQRLHKVTDAR